MAVDSDELAKKYMAKYNELVDRKNNSDINKTLQDINDAIKSSDMDRVSKAYNEILDWNFDIANLDGVRDVLNAQFKHLHLPSPIIFTIAYDEAEKIWTFNG